MNYEDMKRRDRLRRIGAFIAETRQFGEAKTAFAKCYNDWQCSNEGTCTFLVGETGAGKTTVADDFLDELRAEIDATASDAEAAAIADVGGSRPETWGVTKTGDNGLVRPVVKVFVKPKVRFNALLRDTLHALGIRAPGRADFGELMSLLRLHLQKQEVRMLVFDEVHHIVEGHGKATAYEAADVFKMLLIQARVQIVCIGLPHAEQILSANDQLDRRCGERCLIEPLNFDPHDEAGELRQFLSALEAILPFEAASDIASESTATRIHLATEGFVGKITKLVHVASALAIDRGIDCVKAKLLAAAYKQINRVGDNENPFTIATCDAASIAKIKAQIARRRASTEEHSEPKPGRRKKDKRPDFQV